MKHYVWSAVFREFVSADPNGLALPEHAANSGSPEAGAGSAGSA